MKSEEKESDKSEAEKLPVARIDFLGCDGSVGDSKEYFSEEEFLKAVKEELYYGVPLVIVLYRDREGKTIPRTFIKDLDTLPKGLITESAPDIKVRQSREERDKER